MSVHDLSMFRGDDRTFAMAATLSGAPLNLTGAAITFTARRTPEEVAALITRTIGTGVTITNAAGGLFTVNIAQANTSAFLVDEQLIWDVEIVIGGVKRTVPEDAAGKPKYGTLKVKMDVTHA